MAIHLLSFGKQPLYVFIYSRCFTVLKFYLFIWTWRLSFILPKTRLVRSSRSQILFKVGVLQNFPNFTGKQTHVLESFLNIIAGLKAATLLKRDSTTGVFLAKKKKLFAKFIRTPFLTEHLRWLLLCFANYLYKGIFQYQILWWGLRLKRKWNQWMKNLYVLEIWVGEFISWW